jgi:hypothetical protein
MNGRIQLVVEFADVRVLAFGTLANPRSPFLVNVNAHHFLHPKGIDPYETDLVSNDDPVTVLSNRRIKDFGIPLSSGTEGNIERRSQVLLVAVHKPSILGSFTHSHAPLMPDIPITHPGEETGDGSQSVAWRRGDCNGLGA